ncbi:MAG TPA: AarF/UbiB family protein [Burkholderiales bacterium]|jgi:ubiquinone biosynthesis protein|nr:AarF/UbiB family protein [Burkholderiales bacterium]
MLETLDAARDLRRLSQLAAILVRHGLGDLARRAGVPRLRTGGPQAAAGASAPRRVRLALGEMGPTFVKLGQILSTRVDLFAPEWIEQFEQLQDHAAPVPFDDIQRELAQALGADPSTAFARFEAQPVAAGSIAQVHRAWLHDGRPVAVKIRRPGIEAVIEADLRLLGRLAQRLQRESPAIARYQPRALVRQFAKSLRRELDLRMECRNAERIAASLAGEAGIVVPAIHWQWTSPRVNVQDLVEGIPGRDLRAVDEAGLDRALLARRGARAVLKMVLADGFFHADPHPGNVFYLPGNRVALIDFGMVGRLSPPRREQLAELLHAIARRDARRASELLADWSEDSMVDLPALEDDVAAFIDEFHGLPLEQIEVGRLLGDFTALMREHGLVLPADLAMLFKAALSLEGLGRLLDPAFDMVSEARPFLESLVRGQRSPRRMLRTGSASVREALALALQLPFDLRRLLRLAERGAVTVHIDVSHFDQAWARMDRSVSRLTMGIVTAALIVGSSIVMTTRSESTWLGLPLFGLLGFLGALAGGAWLLVSILRSGRRD